MIITKGIKFSTLASWTGIHLIWLIALSAIVTTLYYFGFITIVIPWLPIFVIGTVVAALLSSYNDIAVDNLVCFSGEVGLSGEIRAVNKIDIRIAEAEKLGYHTIYISIIKN